MTTKITGCVQENLIKFRKNKTKIMAKTRDKNHYRALHLASVTDCLLRLILATNNHGKYQLYFFKLSTD